MKKTLLLLSVAALMASADANAQNWSLTGNAGTTSTNFLGTTDTKPLKIKTNNQVRMTITNTGRVGIATQTPASRLDVVGNANDTAAVILSTVKYAGTVDVSAVKGLSTSTDSTGIGVEGNGNLTGIYGYGNNFGGYGYGFVGLHGESYYTGTTGYPVGTEGIANGGAYGAGVYGYSDGALNNDFGVWGDAFDTVTVGGLRDYAGYFSGNVFGMRFFQLSDERYKKNIAPLDNVIEKLMKVRTATYNFKTDEFPAMHMPAGIQTGFIAQNLKEFFPNVVSSTTLGEKRDLKTGKLMVQGGEAEVVNYDAMIPVLTKAIQEQQVMIEAKNQMINALQQQLAALEQRISRIEGSAAAEKSTLNVSGASLEQNTPNPFNGSTLINYTLPENTTNAKLVITSINGQVVRTMNLTGKGKGQVQLQASELQAGSYMYSLYVNGRLVDTKALLLSK
ncbi:MAG: tail fiber domain-containing protein [Bacteroidia bacterium]